MFQIILSSLDKINQINLPLAILIFKDTIDILITNSDR